MPYSPTLDLCDSSATVRRVGGSTTTVTTLAGSPGKSFPHLDVGIVRILGSLMIELFEPRYMLVDAFVHTCLS
jgi:hypothetical protein